MFQHAYALALLRVNSNTIMMYPPMACRRVICFKELDQIGPEWQGLSEDAVDFVKSLLIKDHEKVSLTSVVLLFSYLSTVLVFWNLVHR